MALDYLVSARELGIELPDAIDKISRTIELLDSNEITIALLGSVSDGKTTMISGLLGKTMANMKIDVNESSDEIEVYESEFLGKQFRFVDTPGLFGKREKINEQGQKCRFSNVTEKYISQANAVIYVTEVSNPLPQSHQEQLRHIMNDLRKLDNAIFVINKMDEKYDPLDEYEYADGVAIKTENLRERLKECLGLSESEAAKLTIICISAKPNSARFQTIEDWFEKYDEYLETSHIENLKDGIKGMVSAMDTDTINIKTAIDTAIDAVTTTEDAIDEAKRPVKKALNESKPFIRDMRDRLESAQTSIAESKSAMIDNLNILESNIKRNISGASVDTIAEIINTEIGCSDNKIDFSIVVRNIESELSKCAEVSNITLERTATDMFEQEGMFESMMKDAFAKGASSFKNANVTPEMVGRIRDEFFKSHKFKPYGKINMAAKATKWIGRIGVGLTVIMEAYNLYKKYKANDEVKKAKQQLLDEVTNIFNQAHKTYATQEDFLKNFAPGLIELKNLVEAKDAEINSLNERIRQMEYYQDKLKNWREQYAEDAEYTTI